MLAAIVVLAALYHCHCRLTASKHLLDPLPWVGVRDELFAKSRAHLREATDSWDLLKEGYAKWSQQEKTFVIPNITFRPEAILPQSHIPWLVKQPVSVLSTKPAQVSLLELEWLAPARIYDHPLHEEVIRKDLTRHLNALHPAIADAVSGTIDRVWAVDADWKHVPALETLSEIIVRISNRVFVGEDLYHDEGYLKVISAFSTVFILAAIAIKALIPDILKPILAPLIALPNKYCLWRCRRYLDPIISERLKNLRRRESDPSAKHPEEPEDFLQWMTRAAFSHPDKGEANASIISTRILLMEMTAIHTSTSTIANTVLDLLSADPSRNYVDGIRAQALAVLSHDNGVWTSAGIRKLTRADSAIRESLRFSGFAARGAKRQVMAPGGVTLPDGSHLPQNAWLSIPVAAIHHDSRFYPDPGTYDAFRFSDAREEMLEALRNRGAGGRAELYELLQEKRLSLSTTSDAFVPFGHGQHSCPGRFFAAQVLKLILAYITVHYDIEPLPTRPQNTYMSDFSAPSTTAKLRIRRRPAPTGEKVVE
ncbi:cytochrome P450 [Saccharata proteae CBS 121410]|uniref:Cytochrome P450 n=1 Tax=Saccharata proteae CBS 121410 TaxID=1314787 RepID=A0A9P4I2J1_9PEZI|nr:cytochrome P450 [Saccharata proteae CBS 121410]